MKNYIVTIAEEDGEVVARGLYSTREKAEAGIIEYAEEPYLGGERSIDTLDEAAEALEHDGLFWSIAELVVDEPIVGAN